MFRILSNVLRLGLAPAKQVIFSQFTNKFHILSQPKQQAILPSISVLNQFLKPDLITVNQNCGFKVKGRLRRRCKDCYFVMREKRLYVICKTHPRHKQMSMVKKESNTWQLTHATMGKIRPW